MPTRGESPIARWPLWPSGGLTEPWEQRAETWKEERLPKMERKAPRNARTHKHLGMGRSELSQRVLEGTGNGRRECRGTGASVLRIKGDGGGERVF